MKEKLTPGDLVRVVLPLSQISAAGWARAAATGEPDERVGVVLNVQHGCAPVLSTGVAASGLSTLTASVEVLVDGRIERFNAWQVRLVERR